MRQSNLLLRRALPLATCIGLVVGCGGVPAPSVAPSPAAATLPGSRSVAPSPAAATLPGSGSVAPSVAPSPPAAALPASGSIAPGIHRISSPFPVTFDLALEDGWTAFAVDACCVLLGHHDFRPPGLVMFSAWTTDAVYTDPCRHVLGPPVGPGVDALVSTLGAVPALGATAAVAATIDGRPATHLTLELPDDIDPSDCVDDEFAMWAYHGEETRYVPPGYRDAVDELWILEVDGHRIVLDGSLAQAGEPDRAELDAIVRSVRLR